MFPSLPPLEHLVPIMGIITNNNKCTCDVHRFGWGDMLMLVRTAHSFGVLLHLPDMASDELTVWCLLHDGKKHLQNSLRMFTKQKKLIN